MKYLLFLRNGVFFCAEEMDMLRVGWHRRRIAYYINNQITEKLKGLLLVLHRQQALLAG